MEIPKIPISQAPLLLEYVFAQYDERKFKKIAMQKVTKIGQGYVLNDKKREKLKVIDIMNENRKNHIFLFGSTGVGKTRSAELMVIQDIYAGRNVVYIDPKSDADMLNTIIATAIKPGRMEDLMYVRPIFPEFCIPNNPTSH